MEMLDLLVTVDTEVRMDIQEGTTVTTAGDTISSKDIVLRNADLSSEHL